MSHNRASRGITAGVGTAEGVLLAGALITLATAPTAGADETSAMGNALTADHFSDLLTGEGTQADQAVDNFYRGIANFFAPEAMGNAGAQAAVTLTGEGNPVDQAVDNFYHGIANFFAPEAMGNTVTADLFSDMFTGEGTQADQMVDAIYQTISTAFQPEGPIDGFLDSMFGVSP